MKMPRIILAGTSSGVGKTTIAMGLLKALKNRGLKVQPFKSGPDYIDTAFHSHVTGEKSRNLDGWMLSDEANRMLFAKSAMGKDIAIIEGAMGLYDGAADGSNTGSTAYISKVLDAPVVLIVNGKGASTSIAATVLGFAMFDKEVNIAGVIVNKVHGENHYKLVKEDIEKHTSVRCLGYMNINNNINLDSRHLGLIPSVEVEALDDKIEALAGMIEETVDINGILEISQSTSDVLVDFSVREKKYKDIRIGVALDKAFNFYYEDNFQLLRDLGAELVNFSPIADMHLPENLHGLYIGGGFPEVFAEEIQANKSLMADIRTSIEAGMPAYAECGGLMFMCNTIENLEGSKHKTVGIINRDSIMTKRLQKFGYVQVELIHDSIIGKKGLTFRAHEFHRSKLVEKEANNFMYAISKKRQGVTIEHNCGYNYKNFLGGYPHIHFYANLDIPVNFLNNCSKFKRGENNDE